MEPYASIGLAFTNTVRGWNDRYRFGDAGCSPLGHSGSGSCLLSSCNRLLHSCLQTWMQMRWSFPCHRLPQSAGRRSATTVSHADPKSHPNTTHAPIVIVLATMRSRLAALIVASRASWLTNHRRARAAAQRTVIAIKLHLKARRLGWRNNFNPPSFHSELLRNKYVRWRNLSPAARESMRL